jgi:mRNA interferase RelE/StbE
VSAWTIVIALKAEKDILALDPVARKRLGKKLMELSGDPIRLSKKLVNSDLGTYRYRVGDYRVVFDLSGHTIHILRVGHRREIYR